MTWVNRQSHGKSCCNSTIIRVITKLSVHIYLDNRRGEISNPKRLSYTLVLVGVSQNLTYFLFPPLFGAGPSPLSHMQM